MLTAADRAALIVGVKRLVTVQRRATLPFTNHFTTLQYTNIILMSIRPKFPSETSTMYPRIL